MSNKIKDFRTTTANDLKIGDEVRFINIPYNEKDQRMSYFTDKVIDFKPTKSGKRVRVVFENGGEWSLQGWNTTLETSPASFWDQIIKERGFKK